MTAKKPSARSVAAEHGSATDIWINHAQIENDDLEWLTPVRKLTMWAVDVPAGFLAKLPNLRLLDLRGGSAKTAEAVAGCTQLHGLVLNQIRGLHDVSTVAELTSLRLLSLYGLPQLRVPPSLDRLTHLARLELGSMKGFETIEPLLHAPVLQELQLARRVALTEHDVDLIAKHHTLAKFLWITEDVPLSTWKPIVERVSLPATESMFPEDWLAMYPD